MTAPVHTYGSAALSAEPFDGAVLATSGISSATVNTGATGSASLGVIVYPSVSLFPGPALFPGARLIASVLADAQLSSSGVSPAVATLLGRLSDATLQL